MKFFVVFSALAMQCATAKSWHADTYAAESTWTLGWFSYFRRMFILAFVLLAIVLYYIPQARPHARRVCIIMIDIIASSIKLALGANEAEYLLGEMKSEPTRPGEQQSLYPENFANPETPRRNRIPVETATFNARQREGRSIGSKLTGDDRFNGKTDHTDRTSVIKDPARPRTEYLLPATPRPEKFVDVKKYLRSRLSHVKEFESANLDNYIILVSRTPWQAGGMRDKYAKNDLVILHDGPSKLDFKDSYTWTDRAPTKHLESTRLQGAPKTQKISDEERGRGGEFVPKVTAESRNPKYAEYKTSQNQSEEYEVSNYSRATTRANEDTTPVSTSTVAKSPGNETRSKYRPRENYVSMKSYDSNERKERNQLSSSRQSSTKEKHSEGLSRGIEHLFSQSRKSAGNENLVSGCGCSGGSFSKEPGDEGENETSEYKEVVTANYDLDEKPERESSAFAKSLENELIFDCELDTSMPHTKPTLLRAVDWLFGSCPGAARPPDRQQQQHQQQIKVGKEESKGVTSGWLL